MKKGKLQLLHRRKDKINTRTQQLDMLLAEVVAETGRGIGERQRKRWGRQLESI